MTSKDALYYWDHFVDAKARYLLIRTRELRDLEDKNLLLEIMVGNLLGFIEEICKDPNPTLPTNFASVLPAKKQSNVA